MKWTKRMFAAALTAVAGCSGQGGGSTIHAMDASAEGTAQDAEVDASTPAEAGSPPDGGDAATAVDAPESGLEAAAPSAWPDATNTGYKRAPCYAGALTPFSGTIESGKTYSCLDFPGGVSVGSRAAQVTGVTFVGCRFHGTAVGNALVTLYGDDLTFDYSTFEPDLAAPPVPYAQSYEYGIEADGGYYTHVAKLTVMRSDFWGFADAIDIDGSTQARPQVFSDNWIHDAAADGGVSHTDGIGTLSGSGNGSYVTIHHNAIVSVGNTQAIAFQGGSFDHFTITDNLLGGFGYTVAVVGGSYINVSGNTFTTAIAPTYGPLYTTTGFTGYPAPWQWRGNHWEVPSGAQWGLPKHDGWFWMPVAADRHGGMDDTPFVSQTDSTD